MRISRARVLLLGTVFVAATCLAPTRAAAQDRKLEVSGGWSFAHEGGSDGEESLSIPAGWFASAGGYLNNWLGIVGEVNGHYKTVNFFDVDVDTSFHVYGVGPKFMYRGNPRFTLFAQTLFGAGRLSASALGIDESTSGFSYQPSAGVEINNGSGTLGFRLAVGRAGIRSEGEWFADTLVNVGLVIRR